MSSPSELLWAWLWANATDGHYGTDPNTPNRYDLWLLKGTQP